MACLICACAPAASPSLGRHEAKSVFATCDTVMCADPSGCAAQCEAEYGQTSGIPYSYLAMFQDPPCTTSTNSDCYSECFHDCCVAGGAEEDIPVCSCAMVAYHNYWCCQEVSGQNPWGTIQGWTNTNYCAGVATTAN